MNTLPSRFLATTRRLAGSTAMRRKKYGIWHDITWQQYRERALEVAAALGESGLKPGDRVAIIGENGPEWLYIDMGIQLAGGVSVGIYTTNSREQCEYVVNHAECTFLFAENEEQVDKWLWFRDRAPQLRRVIYWDPKGLSGFSEPGTMTFDDFLALGREQLPEWRTKLEAEAAGVNSDDLAILVYTSGTTGMPKGAMLTHANLTWVADAITAIDPELEIGEHDEVMSFLPLCHIFERMFSVYVHITAGYVVNFIESPDTVMENMREIAPTIGYAVPRIWEKYYSGVYIKMGEATRFKKLLYALAIKYSQDYAEVRLEGGKPRTAQTVMYYMAWFAVFRKLRERLGMHRMKVAFSGAAPISPDILKFFHGMGMNLVEGYGQTEGSGVTTGASVSAFRLGCVGRPVPGCEVRLADDGEILVKSPGVFKGYLKDEEETARALRDGWLHSGDIGEMDADGYLRIVDRKKDIIITAGGKNIAPQYIENKLKFCPYINDAIVIGDRKKFLSALIVLDEENVMKYARDHKIAFATYSDLAGSEAMQELIGREVGRVNKELARVEHVRAFRILPKKLYEEDGEVTPTMKVKRSFINRMYGELIKEMYGEG
jgi:long-chain acyl-CoA synthetase